MNKGIIFIAIFMLSFCFVLPISGLEAHDYKIKVGILHARTGPLKEFGPEVNKSIVLAAEQMEKAGFSIGLIQEDSQSSADYAVSAAERLVNLNHVVAVIGALASSVTVSVARHVTCPDDVIMISPASTSPFLTVLAEDRKKDFLFRTCPSDALQGFVAGKLAASENKTASGLYVDSAYGKGIKEQFSKSFTENGGSVLAMIPHDEKVADSYSVQLAEALAQNPDILCVFSYPEHAKIYLKEAVEKYGYKKFLFCDGTKSEDIIKAVGWENIEDQMGTAPGIAGGEQYELFKEYYIERFEHLPPLPFIHNAYDAMAVIGLAGYAARSKGLELNPENIRDNLRVVANPPGEIIKPGEFKKAFEKLQKGEKINYEGASGPVDFDENGDVISPVEVWKFKGGKIVTVRMDHIMGQEFKGK
ncbi:ABC transporter substrate-binding protein [Desulfobacterales bacterium HSG16]|nr:ABC transporter substrate-binding protein [Desulfobacterales bacterium HSG16]